MTTTLLEQYAHALTEFDTRVALIGDEQWSDPTPCTGWDVRTLVAHVVDETRWAPYLLTGGTVSEAGDRFSGDPLGDDPKAAWRDAAAGARTAFAAEGALDHTVSRYLPGSAGAMGARDYLWEMTVDATVHAWDLARALGADERLDPELVRRIHNQREKDPEAFVDIGLFAPPVQVAAHADLQARMLGLMGRRS